MADEKKEITQTGAEVDNPTPAKEPKTKGNTKNKVQKSAKADGPSMLKAVGREACKLHKLAKVWVTDDGQCFPMESDAKAHAANLTNKELIEVTAE